MKTSSPGAAIILRPRPKGVDHMTSQTPLEERRRSREPS